MNAWPVVELQEICRPKQWPTVSTSELLDTGYPVFGANGRIGYYSKYNHEEPTVLITCRGATCGTINISDPKSYVTGNAMALDDLDLNRVDRGYLARALRKEGLLRKAITGSAQPQITRQSLSGVMIPLPPLLEQKRIAAVLDHVDALSAKRHKALAILDGLTQSIFLDMFGDPLLNPRNWIREKIESLLLVKPSYGTMIPANEQQSDHLCIRVANIQNWSLDLSSRKYVDLSPGDVERHGVSSGDLLMARAIATQEHLGKAIVAEPGDEKWAFDSHILRLRFDPTKANPHYIQALLATPSGRSIFLKATRRSSVQYNINSKEISALEVPVPPIAEQERFRSALTSVDRARKTHGTHLSALDELFTSVQQRAFSGTLWDHEAAA